MQYDNMVLSTQADFRAKEVQYSSLQTLPLTRKVAYNIILTSSYFLPKALSAAS